MTYDALGRLQADTNPAGGFTYLTRAELADGLDVMSTSAMNYLPSRYSVRNLASGMEYRENVGPDGSTNRVWAGSDDVTTIQYADGTVSVSQKGPDPRWGMQAPITTRMTVSLPSGNSMATTARRTVTLADPTSILTLTNQTDTLTVNNLTFTSTYSFDGVNPTITATSPLGRTSVSILDDKGRVIQSAVPGIAPVNYQYDNRGRLISVSQSADGQTRTVTYTYDQSQNGGASSGRLTAITDSLNRTITFTYDPNLSGRVVQQTFPNGQFIQFQYDANGNLTGVTPPQKPVHLFEFNAVDLLSQYTPPPAPNTGNNFTSYEYNLNGQLTRITRPDGLQIAYVYDPQIGGLTTWSCR